MESERQTTTGKRTKEVIGRKSECSTVAVWDGKGKNMKRVNDKGKLMRGDKTKG